MLDGILLNGLNLAQAAAPGAAHAAEVAKTAIWANPGLALLGAGLGVGLATIGAGFGISKIASASVESMARQPEVAGDIRGAMILTAALIEGVALFSCAICFLIQSGVLGTN